MLTGQVASTLPVPVPFAIGVPISQTNKDHSVFKKKKNNFRELVKAIYSLRLCLQLVLEIMVSSLKIPSQWKFGQCEGIKCLAHMCIIKPCALNKVCGTSIQRSRCNKMHLYEYLTFPLSVRNYFYKLNHPTACVCHSASFGLRHKRDHDSRHRRRHKFSDSKV